MVEKERRRRGSQRHDRAKLQQLAISIKLNGNLKIKARHTKKPPQRATPAGIHRCPTGQRILDEWQLERAGKTSQYNSLNWHLF